MGIISQYDADNNDSNELFEDVQSAINESLARTEGPEWAVAYMLGQVVEALRDIREKMDEFA